MTCRMFVTKSKNFMYREIMETRDLAKEIRIDILKMTSAGGSSHIASGLSIADILAMLYGKILNVDPKKPDKDDRDFFILSKGHAGAAVYSSLARAGFFSTEKLMTHYQDGSDLSGHVSHKGIPGVELSTGSLGHGLNVGVGIALANKMDQKKNKTFVLLSDGECDEGSNWEAILFAAHHKLSNVTAVIDYNKIQSLAPVAETIALEPFASKWESFGWRVLEVDGHDHEALEKTFKEPVCKEGKPTVVIAHTTKGKGVSFMEDTVLWHYRCAKGQEFDDALRELGGN